MTKLQTHKETPVTPVADPVETNRALQNLMNWDPFRTDVFRGMDPFRMFPWDMFRTLSSLPTYAPSMSARPFVPDFEFKENKDRFSIKADVPGLAEKDLDISISGNRITVTGTRQDEKRTESDQYYTSEINYGAFTRTYAMPDGADMDRVEAELNQGVLTISVPKTAAAQTRKVTLKKVAESVKSALGIEKHNEH